MEYAEIKDMVCHLDFIHDEEEADSAIKAVLMVWASRMSDAELRELVDVLPAPLTYEELSGRRSERGELSAEQFFETITSQLHLVPEQYQLLIRVVLDVIRDNINSSQFTRLEAKLPGKWLRAETKV